MYVQVIIGIPKKKPAIHCIWLFDIAKLPSSMSHTCKAYTI